MKILQQQKLTLMGIMRGGKINRLGAILHANTIVGHRGAISIVCRLINTSTGLVLWLDKPNIKVGLTLIQFESQYKRPMEVADYLPDHVIQKPGERVGSYFSDLASVRSPSANLYP